jgi:hypothetical protein
MAREDAALAAHAGPEYASMVEEAHRVPVDERTGWSSTYAGQDHLEGIEEALRASQGIDLMSEQPAARAITLAVPRPYGARRRIEEDVATWATGKLGRKVSVRMVRSCWSELRQLKARLAAV